MEGPTIVKGAFHRATIKVSDSQDLTAIKAGRSLDRGFSGTSSEGAEHGRCE